LGKKEVELWAAVFYTAVARFREWTAGDEAGYSPPTESLPPPGTIIRFEPA
jgi:hypothetical protein